MQGGACHAPPSLQHLGTDVARVQAVDGGLGSLQLGANPVCQLGCDGHLCQLGEGIGVM